MCMVSGQIPMYSSDCKPTHHFICCDIQVHRHTDLICKTHDISSFSNYIHQINMILVKSSIFSILNCFDKKAILLNPTTNKL